MGALTLMSPIASKEERETANDGYHLQIIPVLPDGTKASTSRARYELSKYDRS